MKSLLIYPTHKNCWEVEDTFIEKNIDALAYEPRSTEETEFKRQNCWNQDADHAEKIGLSVTKAVCPTCPSRKRCLEDGYLQNLVAVQEADVAIATHKRAEYAGLEGLMDGRHYVSIHENPIDLLCPSTEVLITDLVLIQHILDRILNDPHYLNWFGNALRVDENGKPYHDEGLALRKNRQYEFCHHLADLVDDLAQHVQKTERSVEWKYPSARSRPEGIERTLFYVTRKTGINVTGQPWRFLLSAAAGELRSAGIIVTEQFSRGGGQQATSRVIHILGIQRNLPVVSAVTWINDATSPVDLLSTILGGDVHDKTPDGQLAIQKQAILIPRDITRKTSLKVVEKLVRGVLADRPQFQRIGLIMHRPHLAVIGSLEPIYAQRIVKSSYFGSGDERSSNSWHEECDLILIVGTPRVPPYAIARYLMQVGNVGAACREPTWGSIRWRGVTQSGETITVKGRGYRDADWQRANHDLVRAELVQCIGRGRGILEHGCEVVVLSTQECGLPVSESEPETLNKSAAAVLSALQQLTMESPKVSPLGLSIVSTHQIASTTGLSDVSVREILRQLDRRGLARKVGERGGWCSVDSISGSSSLVTESARN